MKTNILKFKEALLGDISDILVVPHLSPDGDAIGSCVAIKYLLNKFNKNVFLYVNEPVSKKYGEFADMFTVVPETDRLFDMVIYVDCGDKDRTCVKFPAPKITVSIDHHISNNSYADINIIDAKAPATGEIVFEIYDALNISLDVLSAKAIYMALICDTGGFMFDNTRKRTLEIASILYDFDFSKYDVANKALLTKSLVHNKLTAKIIDEVYIKDDIAIGYIDYKTYSSYNVKSEDTDGLSNVLRNIEGINCGILLTEKEEGITKGSIRTEVKYDANKIASLFGGGGHLRAAGFTVQLKPQDVRDKLNEWLFTDK